MVKFQCQMLILLTTSVLNFFCNVYHCVPYLCSGATLVTALAAMPGSNKLFARAWASSGGAIYPRKTLSESELENQSFLNSINCDNVTCLRQLNAEFLTNAVFDTWRKSQPDLPAKGESPEKRHEWLVLDGE